MGLIELDNKIKRLAIKPVEGQEWYFEYKEVIKATKLCIEYKATILGFEGFDKEGTKIIPDMGAIFDNSSGENFCLKKVKLNFFNKVEDAEKKIWSICYSE